MKKTTLEHLYEKWIQILVLKSPKSMVLVPSLRLQPAGKEGRWRALLNKAMLGADTALKLSCCSTNQRWLPLLEFIPNKSIKSTISMNILAFSFLKNYCVFYLLVLGFDIKFFLPFSPPPTPLVGRVGSVACVVFCWVWLVLVLLWDKVSCCLFFPPLVVMVVWGGNLVCWWLGLCFCLVCCFSEVFCTGCCQQLADDSSYIQVEVFMGLLTN